MPPSGDGADEALFVYGVVRAGTGGPERRADGLTGIHGSTVDLIVGGSVAAAVTTVALEEPPRRRADLLAYQSVLDALHRAGPVAPVQFGSVLWDAATVVEELLLPQEDRFNAVLDRLEGKQQYNLRASFVEESVLADLVATDPDVAALRERTRDQPETATYPERVRLGELVARALEDRSADEAEVLWAAVEPLTAEHRVRTPPTAQQVLDVALLVEEDRATELVERLEDLAEAVHERIRMRLVGPLAPYDFVDEGSGWV
ncbi:MULTISPECIES: GvpL/GvpF family gas vesicle protein [unclassified Nocardioides]|jgi:Gas vesicle synthesis protein GvpL/GvpF|uniref:GvpL/GvpF family gas vesicle protein n=1 Tax=Nocardioides sp. URHA0032 TaxID=1380388 RepID=UPI00048F6759|nr:GvpL/GvpF family gas vesicle protein [Nocardioides sp. URHA0032]